MSRKTKTIARLAAGCVALAVPVTAQAQASGESAAVPPGDEIVVTAQRRDERSVDVPITVTTLSRQALESANVQELRDIAKVTPSLRFDSQAAFFQPTIRGIGTSVTTSGGGANVGIYVDGFYSPNPLAADFDLLNVRNIQVLKGPQGSLFGRNTTGGAILIQSAEPSEETAGQIKASYARFDQAKVQGYFTTALTEGLAVDLEGQYRRGDGWIRNLATGKRDAGGFENWSVRAGLRAQLGERASVLVRYIHADVDDPTSLLTNVYNDPVLGPTAPNFAPPTTFTTKPNFHSANPGSFFRSVADIAQATVRIDLGFADLTSYTQYRQEDVDTSEDLDHSLLTVFHLGLPVRNETTSQEFLLTSQPGSRLQWTAGLFYFSNRDTYRTFIDNNVATFGRIPIGGSSTTSRSYAAFADLTYELTPQLFATVGGRYSHDQIDEAYYIRPFSGQRTYVTQAQSDAVSRNRFTPRVVLRYKPDDRSSIYASYTQGYKAGILDVGGSTGNPVQPEKVDAFEAGFKFDNRRFAFEAAAFHYDYTNLQVSLFQGNPPSAQIVNAASSRIYGLEGQVRFKLSDAFQLNGGVGWTHARYRRFVNAPIYTRCPGVAGCGGGTSYFIQTGVTLRDVTMTRTPEFTGNVGARYGLDLAGGELALSGNLYYSSKVFFGPSGIQFPQKGYEVLALRGQWSAPEDRFFIAAFGDNVTGSRYRTQVQYNNFAIGSAWNSPMTYGIEVGAKF